MQLELGPLNARTLLHEVTLRSYLFRCVAKGSVESVFHLVPRHGRRTESLIQFPT